MEYLICFIATWLFFGVFCKAFEVAENWEAIKASYCNAPVSSVGKETYNILVLMHWHWIESERVNNYCSETNTVWGFLQSIGRIFAHLWKG